jgi:hypothetical protein
LRNLQQYPQDVTDSDVTGEAMFRIRLVACAVAVGIFFGLQALAQESTTVLFTFDEAKIGPRVVCDGQFELRGGGQLAVQPWCNDGKDSLQDTTYTITTGHDAKTAEATKLRAVYRSSIPRGMILEIDSPASATLIATTELGDFEVTLDELKAKPIVSFFDDKAQLHRIPNVSALTGDQGEEEYPSITLLPDGQVAVAYVAWDGKEDAVMLRIGDDVRKLARSKIGLMDPRIAVDGTGNLLAVWTACDGRRWSLWAHDGEQARQITDHPTNDFWPRLARDRAGRIWLAWQRVAADDHFEVMLGQLGPEGIESPVNVSEHEADDWEPAICTTADGRVVVAWDTYRNGSYDIYLRQYTVSTAGNLEPTGPATPVAATARREAHATLATDSQSRVWIAWDESVVNWGKHPVGAKLHSDRSSAVACLANGSFKRLPMPLMKGLPGPFRKFIEYPQVAIDGKDRLWVVFRFQNRVHPFYTAKGRRAQSYGMWHLFATQFDGKTWSLPVLLARSNGRQDMRPDVATDANGRLLIAFAADGRTRRFPYMPVDYDVFLTRLGGFGADASVIHLQDAADLGVIEPVDHDPELDPLPRRWSIGGKDYRLVLGDTHRHTDISRCANGQDGSLQDAYRYALNTVGLDWLAISDHDQDILKHRNDHKQRPRQDYDWWRSEKYCQLVTIPDRFVAIYGYEHGGSYKARGGHKNIMLAERGHGVEEVDAPDELFAALADSGALAIPHQLADGPSRTDWEKWNEEFERVGEIFQTRGSYEYLRCPREASINTEGNTMWSALAKGIRIGIIASSDHGQTHQARAGVYVDDLPEVPADLSHPAGFTRGGIIEALKARRAYGATTAVTMQVSVDDHLFGEEITVDDLPTLNCYVAAPESITAVEVVRDNQFVFTTRPDKSEVRFQFQDADLKPGQSAYYYVRAKIGKQDIAWTSPLWIERKAP